MYVSATMLYLVLIIICLVLSAFFSGSETAFIALQRVRVEHMVGKKVPGAERVARIMRRPERLLSTVLLGNNLVNTTAAALATSLAISIWGNEGVFIATITMTVVLLVFGDSTPKVIAAHYAERLSFLLARPIEAVSWLFTPFVIALSWFTSGVTKLFGGAPMPRSLVGEEEIRTMISMAHKEGTVEEDKAEMLHKVFDFGSRPAREVMVPRTEVVWVEKGTKLANLLSVYTQVPFSRFPVYQDSLDNVVGIVSTKDVVMALAKGTINNEDAIDNLVRPAYFAPETKPIDELFTEMRDNNYHMSIVVDEFGSTAGVVTLSDLLEEIVGPMGDELTTAKEYETIDDYTFHIDGSMRIEEANEKLGLGLPLGEYQTIAGFLLDLLKHIPKQGQSVKYKGLKLVVTEMRGQKIEKVLVTKERHATPAS